MCGNCKHFQLGDVVGMLLGGRRTQQPTINRSGKGNQRLLKEQQDSGWRWSAIGDSGRQRKRQRLHNGGADKCGRRETQQQAKEQHMTLQPTIIGSVKGGWRLATRVAGYDKG
jgi:hypothetical protein